MIFLGTEEEVGERLDDPSEEEGCALTDVLGEAFDQCRGWGDTPTSIFVSPDIYRAYRDLLAVDQRFFPAMQGLEQVTFRSIPVVFDANMPRDRIAIVDMRHRRGLTVDVWGRV